MKKINVYGSGCKNCAVTAERIEQVAQRLDQNIQLTKVFDLEAVMEAGVISTPAVAIDGHLVHTGSVPTIEKLEELLGGQPNSD